MQTYTRVEYKLSKNKLVQKIKEGAIFIYPTDTIYGIGCDATNEKAVAKIREIKGNFKRPFSVIVPDKEWIYENCDVASREEEWLKKIPGAFTLILNLRNMECVSANAHGGDTLGIRIPDHWCTEIAELSGLPIITTSANLSGGMFMTSLDTLHDNIKKHVDFMIDIGEVKGRPSMIINLAGEDEQVIER